MSEEKLDSRTSVEIAFQQLSTTFDSYVKNVINVPPEELNGKYKLPFEKLKKKLWKELQFYIMLYAVWALYYGRDEKGRDALRDSLRAVRRTGMLNQAKKAVMEEFDLQKAEEYARAARTIVINNIWVPYQHENA